MMDLKPYKKYLLPGIGSLMILVVMAVLGSTVVPKTLVTISKANFSNKVSGSNSYMIGSKIIAKANGEDTCVVNIFAADSKGVPVVGSKVTLTGADTIEPQKGSTTDNSGKSVFKIKSNTEGSLKLQATIDGVPLTKQLTIVFKN